jgi:nitrogen fixation protein FixH
LALVISVNAALIWFAVGSFSGLAEAHPYRAGLTYNQTLAAARAQEALGWKADLVLDPTAKSGTVRVVASLADRSGRPIENMNVEAEFLRPATAGHDRRAVLAPEGGGRYVAFVPLGLRGQWEVRILARNGSGVWQTTRRVMAP